MKPWRYDGRDAIIADEETYSKFPMMDERDRKFYGGHLICESIGPEAARRILACIHACEGIATDELEELVRAGKRVRP